MNTVFVLIKRNIKLFFKDKGMFFTSLITPAILLVLYVTFLGNIYRDNFTSSFSGYLELSEKLVNGLVGGEIISSILAVSCVTVAFCSNFLSVQDKVKGAAKDFSVSPVKPSVMSLSYYFASLAGSLIICYTASALCLIYIAAVGWYMTFADVLLMLADVTLLVLFGNALSSVINVFLSSQGQISAVGTIISSGYGFICGAYMPISSFGSGLQKVISFLPGTYGTALLRNRALNSVLAEIEKSGAPQQAVEALRDSIDCNLYFFEKSVSVTGMCTVLIMSIAVLLALYVLLSVFKNKKHN